MAGKQNRHAWEPRLSRNDFEGGEANETGSMVAGCCCYQDLEVGRRAKVGSAEEGCSSGTRCRPKDGVRRQATKQ